MVLAHTCCPECGCETAADDAYCQECGVFLAKDEGHRANKISVQQGFLNLQKGHEIASLSPRSDKPVVALPIVAGALGILCLAPFAVHAVENSYSWLSTRYSTEQADKALRGSRYDEAIDIMARARLQHNGRFTPEQERIFNESLFKRGQQFFITNNYAQAAQDFSRITPLFEQKNIVASLLAQCNARIAAAPTAPIKMKRSAGERRDRIQKAAQVAQRSTAVSKPIAIAEASRKPKDPGVKSELSTSAAQPMEQRGEKTAKEQPPIKPAAQEGTTSGAPSSAEDKKAAAARRVASEQRGTEIALPQPIGADAAKSTQFSPKDQARYNELLTAFFTRSIKRPGAVQEPPTIKEWLAGGKKVF